MTPLPLSAFLASASDRAMASFSCSSSEADDSKGTGVGLLEYSCVSAVILDCAKASSSSLASKAC